MGFKLSERSELKLEGVHEDLAKVVRRAIEITTVDFRVLEGLRSVERQAMLLNAGATKTMNSRHLTGHAVDLGALLNGEIRWDWPLYHKIAAAMKAAAAEENVPITWGAVWDRDIRELSDNLEDEMTAYATRRKTAGGNPFHDGPHFEISRLKPGHGVANI